MTIAEMSGARFSPCRKYRQLLWRCWDKSLPVLHMAMLNPSQAGEVDNDPTVQRQIVRARKLGCGTLLVTNAYDLISTDPSVLVDHPRPLTEENDPAILDAATRARDSGGKTVLGWGTHITPARQKAVLALLKNFELYSLIVNGDGTPGHPLYIGYSIEPTRFLPA